MEYRHESVLLEETLEGLRIRPEGVYVDGTVGGGGHSFKIVQKLTAGRLIGIDQDSDALLAAKKRLAIFSDRITFLKGNFSNIKQLLAGEGIEKVDGILLDIGVSSYQIDNPERGFSYKEDAPLDMRMDKDAPLTAEDIVNSYSKEELTRIIKTYGEEDFAANIAKHITEAREDHRITSTGELVRIIEGAVPAAVRKGGKGPV